jgi:hypothetical protein
MSTLGSSPQARAWTAWARPISPPSDVTALFKAMFWGLNGATLWPRRKRKRQIPVTRVLFPASEVVPWIIKVGMNIVYRPRRPFNGFTMGDNGVCLDKKQKRAEK